MEFLILARFFSWNLSNFEKLLKFAKTWIFWQKSSDFALICFQSSSNLQNYQISLEIVFKTNLYIVYIQEKNEFLRFEAFLRKTRLKKKKYIYIYIYMRKKTKIPKNKNKNDNFNCKNMKFRYFFWKKELVPQKIIFITQR